MWALLVGLALAAPQDTGGVATGAADTGVPISLDDDADGDGFSPREGDCDDTLARVNPNAVEVCGDRLDNDCDGFFDNGEDCNIAASQGQLRGGGGCTGESGIGAAGIVFLLPFARRRRRD
jgi:hypothetical protein